MAWACNVQGSHGVPVLAHVARAIPSALQQPGCKPQVAANVLHAMSSARYKDHSTLQRIVAWSLPQLGAFKEQECANMAWALARLNHSDSSFFNTLRYRIEADVRKIMMRLTVDMQGEDSQMSCCENSRLYGADGQLLKSMPCSIHVRQHLICVCC